VGWDIAVEMIYTSRHAASDSPFIWRGALGILLFLVLPLCARGTVSHFSYGDGRITCEICPEEEGMSDEAATVLPVAMKVAIQEVGLPDAPAHLTIQLEGPPSLSQRIWGLFHAETFAIQEGDTLRLRMTNVPLNLSFRMAHEFSHWLVSKRYPARPPLWLDEGLANEVGGKAAAIIARTNSQKLERPKPAQLSEKAYTLEALTQLRGYPRSEARIAAFYWQAEALVQAIRKRLGDTEFAVYLGLLASPAAPDWQAPLRERWYFSDGDFEWLARQIQAPAQPPAGR